MPVVAEDISEYKRRLNTSSISEHSTVITSVTTVAFALSAFACDRLGRTIISPFSCSRRVVVRAFAVLVCLAVGLKVARSGCARPFVSPRCQ